MKINITPKALGFAIHRVLASQRVTPGCSISMKELLDAWPQTMLRRTDLANGLESLRKSGHVALEKTPEGPSIRLINEDFGLVRTLEDREAVAMLSRVREMRRRPAMHLTTLVRQAHSRRGGDRKTMSAPPAVVPTSS